MNGQRETTRERPVLTADERDELRRRIDEARRRRAATAPTAHRDNPEAGYKNGCRCDRCRLGNAAARRARRLRRLEREAA